MQSNITTGWGSASTFDPSWLLNEYCLKGMTAMVAGFALSTHVLPPDQPIPQPMPKSSTTVAGYGPISYARSGLPPSLVPTTSSVEMEPNVQSFMMMRIQADLGAIQQIYELAANSFSASIGKPPSIDFEADTDETMGPILFMSVTTSEMDMDEQLRREVEMRETILHDARLSAVKKYVVINVY